VEPELERRAAREQIAALRIDRDAAPPRRGLPRGWLAAGAGALALAGVLAWRLLAGGPAEVRVAFAELGGGGAAAPAAEVLTGSGYVVTGDRYISLGVRVPSRIERYLVEEGERVAAGQPLVELDARQYQAALQESEAALRVTRANVELFQKELARIEELRRQNVSSEAAFDVKQNQLQVARAEVARLQAQVARQKVDLEDTVIRAPTAGVILEKFKEVGEIAVPGGFAGSGELIRMANLDELRAELDVNESELSRIAMGQPARVRPEAYPERSYDARVVKLYPQINRQKGTLKVEVLILEPDEWLRPDMSVRIAFLSEAEPTARGEAAPVVLAPGEAVRAEGGASFAWVVTEGRLRRQPLEVAGPAGDGRVVVAKGLAGGEALVVGEAAGLAEGQAVRVLGEGP
jgi:RND family efflux transporter MFP subunit